MSDDSAQSDPDATLYDPPSEEAQSVPQGGSEEELELDIPRTLADRLRKVALHLGLPPSLVASRAIGMICNEIGLVNEEELSSGEMIQKYQTRLDILHIMKEHTEAESDSDEFTWEAVDDIIRQAEQANSSEND